ncbi:electron transport complex protein RnfG [Hydrogenispora ethanolica]|jgi:electron transport complex protein RnfG|uniref:Ion-translocating oxidoreductase complex subunit G n=1 Tax=Hydrogenispora ethanolica TaxID=1082276 RepID=A0A4R1S490_HYDET|nr:RnfABCDGE type electron transport complex subunit G [Hydrogenispora ethanolica]TCL73172.1 electron transport complex protein RnfG [Hydrogenispora ethanolica]
MRETVKLGIYLMIVAAVAGVALALTHHFTAAQIRAGQTAAAKAALEEVLPGAVEFQPKDDYQQGLDAKRQLVGYVLQVSAAGYSSQIEALVGIDPQYRVTGVKVLVQNETPGLGAKITGPGFLGQFAQKPADQIKLKKDGGTIDGITAATISSRAITDAIRERIHEFQQNHP